MLGASRTSALTKLCEMLSTAGNLIGKSQPLKIIQSNSSGSSSERAGWEIGCSAGGSSSGIRAVAPKGRFSGRNSSSILKNVLGFNGAEEVSVGSIERALELGADEESGAATFGAD